MRHEEIHDKFFDYLKTTLDKNMWWNHASMQGAMEFARLLAVEALEEAAQVAQDRSIYSESQGWYDGRDRAAKDIRALKESLVSQSSPLPDNRM